MNISIRKYTTRTGGIDNYFDRPTFTDSLDLTETLKDGFPIFNEEFSNKLDTFSLTADDFDVKFSLIQPELSTNGDTLEEFFTLAEPIKILAKITIDDKIFGGIVDLESIKINKTKPEKRYDIQFTVFGIEKEFSEWAQGTPSQPPYTTNYFNDYILGWQPNNFFRAANGEPLPIYMDFDHTNLDWFVKIGYHPRLIHELWDKIIVAGRASEVITWKLFEDLCKAFGLVYKFKFEPDNQLVANFFMIKMYVAFRDIGFGQQEVTLDIINSEIGYKKDDNVAKWQIFKSMKASTVSDYNTIVDNVYYGTLFNKNRKYTNDGFVGDGAFTEEEHFINDHNLIVPIGFGLPYVEISKEDVNIVEFNYYFNVTFDTFPNLREYYFFAQQSNAAWLVDSFVIPEPYHKFRIKHISFPRMFTNTNYNMNYYQTIPLGSRNHRLHFIEVAGTAYNIHNWWYLLMENTAALAYLHLLVAFKKSLHGMASLIEGFNFGIFDTTTIDGTTYILEKLSSLDLDKKKIIIEGVEV